MKKSILSIALLSMIGMSSANAAMVMSRPMTISRPITISRPVTVSAPKPVSVSNAAIHTNTAANAVTTMMLINSMQSHDNSVNESEDETYENEVLCDDSTTPEECEESGN